MSSYEGSTTSQRCTSNSTLPNARFLENFRKVKCVEVSVSSNEKTSTEIQQSCSSQNACKVHNDNPTIIAESTCVVPCESLPTPKELVTKVFKTYDFQKQTNMHQKLPLCAKKTFPKHWKPINTSVFVPRFEKRKEGIPNETNVQRVVNARKTFYRRNLSSGKVDTNPEICKDRNEIQIIGEYKNSGHSRRRRSKLFNRLPKNINSYGSFKNSRQHGSGGGQNHVRYKKFQNKTDSSSSEESTDSEKSLQDDVKCQGKFLSGLNNVTEDEVQVIDSFNSDIKDEIGRSKESRQSLKFETEHHLGSQNGFFTKKRILTMTSIFKKGNVPPRPFQSFPKSSLKSPANKGIDWHKFTKRFIKEPQNSFSRGSDKLLITTKNHKVEQVKRVNPISVSENKIFYKMLSIKRKKLKDDKQNGLFVVAPDGTTIQVEEQDKKNAILKATVKMKIINQSIEKIKEIEKAKHIVDTEQCDVTNPFSNKKFQKRSEFQMKGKTKSLLENCVVNIPDNMSVVLPDLIQLVESELPLKEADNIQELRGIYLFSQIYKSCNSLMQCLLCENKKTLKHPKLLSSHYRSFHHMSVKNAKSMFSKKGAMYCAFCGINLDSSAAMHVHYKDVHNKVVKLLCQNIATDVDQFMYCSMCDHPSADLDSHLLHMRDKHKMYTYRCRYCTFCTSKPYFLLNHVITVHNFLKKQVQGFDSNLSMFKCTMCSVFVKKISLKQHVMMIHAVQTGPMTWSCMKCLFPYHDLELLTSHVFVCPKLKENSMDEASSLLYNCVECSFRFSNEGLFNEHMSDVHCQGVSSNLKQKDKGDQTKNTCHLCSITFSSPEMCEKHQYHVHMTWVNNRALDYSGVSQEKNVKDKQNIQLPKSLPCQKKADSKLLHFPEKFDLKIIPWGNGFVFSQEAMKTSKEQHDKIESDASKTYKQLTGFDICLDDLPDGKELTQLGFSNKIGYFCDTCDILIKSYPLYYLHMLNFHHFIKRFQCVISDCGRTFSQFSSFEMHTWYHKQTSEHSCRTCDLVFVDYDALQVHLSSLDHCEKFVLNRGKCTLLLPNNHRCKICYRCFGLSSAFVKHMEFDNHRYQCRICDLVLSHPISRRNHIKNMHPDVANTCEVCGMEFRSSKSLWEHFVSHNTVYKCEICLRKFLHEEHYDAHRETAHRSLISCSWEGCDKKFSSTICLYFHLKIHNSNCNTKCHVCDKDIINEKDLNRHMNIYHSSVYDIAGNLEPSFENLESNKSLEDHSLVSNSEVVLISEDLQSKKSLEEHSIVSDSEVVLISEDLQSKKSLEDHSIVSDSEVVLFSEDLQLKKSSEKHSICFNPEVVPTLEECRNGVLMKACPTQLDTNQQNKTIQLVPVEASIDSIPPDVLIQFACAGCMSIFQTKSLFVAHVCTGDMMMMQ